MPGLESVLLAVYSEGEGKDLVEVRRLVVQVYWLYRSVCSYTGYELSVMCFQLLQRHIFRRCKEPSDILHIETISYFQPFLNVNVFLQALQRAGASLRVLVSPGWLYRGPSITQVLSFFFQKKAIIIHKSGKSSSI